MVKSKPHEISQTRKSNPDAKALKASLSLSNLRAKQIDRCKDCRPKALGFQQSEFRVESFRCLGFAAWGPEFSV